MDKQNTREMVKEGHLNEAYAIAKARYDQNPQQLSARKELAWVIDGYCKKLGQAGDVDRFAKTFLEIMKLDVLHDNYSLNKALSWRLRDLIVEAPLKHPDTDLQYLGDTAFLIAQRLEPKRPSLHFSVLFQAFLSLKDAWTGFENFCHWWNFRNFRDEDFVPPTLANGKKASVSMAESGYIAYAKILLEAPTNANRMERYLAVLQAISEKHPDAQLLIYYEAKLLFRLGRNAEAQQTLLPFVRKRRNLFWVWQTLGEMQTDNRLQLACLLRADSCKAPAEFKEILHKMLAKTPRPAEPIDFMQLTDRLLQSGNS